MQQCLISLACMHFACPPFMNMAYDKLKLVCMNPLLKCSIFVLEHGPRSIFGLVGLDFEI